MASETNLRSFIQNEGLKLLIWSCWLIANLYLFISTFLEYRHADKYRYLYLMLGYTICVSRACAAALNLNCALILIPMCRTLTSWLRAHLIKYLQGNPRRLVNYTKGLHILCAYTICVLGVAHTIAHLINCLRFRESYSKELPDLNPASSASDITLWFFLGTIPGSTGIVMLVILCIVVLSSIQAVRRQRYELFWYTHHLALVFLAILFAHGFGNITKFQSNLEEHPPKCISLTKPIYNVTMGCLSKPMFQGKSPTSWKWLVGPLCLYVVDRIIRFFRGLKVCRITKIVLHEGKVIELHMYKKGFKARPGSYVLLQCPEIADFQWHAFTLTKCPTGAEGDDGAFSVHIKITGNWTESLCAMLSGSLDKTELILKRVGDSCIISVGDKQDGRPGTSLPIIHVDGPYGSPNEDSFRFPVNISVAAGIGITPYAAVLNHLKYLTSNKDHKSFKLQHLHLIWTCRDIKEFTWFLPLMTDTQNHLEEIGLPDLLTCHLFSTNGALVAEDDPSMMDEKMRWFRQRLSYGRPDLKEMFQKIAMNYYKQKIGVFYCGPRPLGRVLYDACAQTKVRGNAFIFHKESFA